MSSRLSEVFEVVASLPVDGATAEGIALEVGTFDCLVGVWEEALEGVLRVIVVEECKS